MKRVLCIRFPNWPIQSLQQRLRSESGCPLALALHTVAPGSTSATVPLAESDVHGDLRFLRAVFPNASAGPAIVAVSRDAWLLGVRPGMPLAEARSMAQPLTANPRAMHRRATRNSIRPTAEQSVAPRADRCFTNPSAEFFEWIPAADRSALMLAAEISRRHAPIVGMDTMPMPDRLLLDITGCGPLFGGEAALAESLLRDLKLAGWTARIAIADTIAAVWALTHTKNPLPDVRGSSRQSSLRPSSCSIQRNSDHTILHELPVQIIPPGFQQQEIVCLPIAATRIPLKDMEILLHLGIRSIGQLLSLPRQDLPSRLSAVAVKRIEQLLSRSDEFIDPLPESNPVAAAWSSEYPANSFGEIRKVLQNLVENVAVQIDRRRVACIALDCDLVSVSGKKLALSAGVVKATQAAELMFEVLSLRLETLPLTEPVSAILMSVRTVPTPASRQRDLFSPFEHIRPQEELATLIARLSNRMGPDSVSTVRMQADPRPEHSIAQYSVMASADSTMHLPASEHVLQRLTESDSDATHSSEYLLPRPLRLLATPQHIAGCEHDTLSLKRIVVLGQQKRIVELDGPERIQTAWWTALPCHRDYYRAVMDTGSQLWIFRELQTGNWFLHGLFD